MTSRESSDEKDRQRQAARESHKKLSLVIARRSALKDMAMDLEKRGSRVLPALATALARPSASSSHRGTCRPRRRNRLRLPKPRCGGDCQHPCPSPSRLSGLFGVPGALDGEAYPNEKLLIAGLPMAATWYSVLRANAGGANRDAISRPSRTRSRPSVHRTDSLRRSEFRLLLASSQRQRHMR